MAKREKLDKALKRSAVLTLRLTQAEMLTFKLSAMSLRTDRAKLVRERVADLIGMTMPRTIGGENAGAIQEVASEETKEPIAEQEGKNVVAVV